MLKIRNVLVEAAMSGHAVLPSTSDPAFVSWSGILVPGTRIDGAMDRRRSERHAHTAARAASVELPPVRRSAGHSFATAPASGATLGIVGDLAAEFTGASLVKSSPAALRKCRSGQRALGSHS
jgi:hypothetical protein